MYVNKLLRELGGVDLRSDGRADEVTEEAHVDALAWWIGMVRRS